MTALAEPPIILPGRPATKRAADARRFRLVGSPLFVKLAIWNYDRIVGDRTQCQLLWLSFRSQLIYEPLFCGSLHDLDGCDRVNLPSGRSPVALSTGSRALGLVLVFHIKQHPANLDLATQHSATSGPAP